MTNYKIAVEWIMHDFVEVKASSMQEAINIVESSTDDLPDGIYLDGSFVINEEITREVNKQNFS